MASLAAGASATAAPAQLFAASDKPPTLAIESEAARLRVRFDPRLGALSIAGLKAGTTQWVPDDAPAGDVLRLDGVQVGDRQPVRIDGGSGLELLSKTASSLTLNHHDTGLRLVLEYATSPGNAITHSLTLVNGRAEGGIYIGSAATLALPLWAGDFTEALAADDAPNGWSMNRGDLPASYGNHELRNASDGVYPLIRLANEDGSGLIIAPSTATAWRVDVERDGVRRWLRAGEYQSDLTLWPGDQAELPDVVTIFYDGGPVGAVEALHRYLRSVSAPPPVGWDNSPPAIFNTWFSYGIDLADDGSKDSTLRAAAREAADSGVEVFVVDAGWYLGSPIPEEVGDRGQGRSVASRFQVAADDEDNDNARISSAGVTADEFNLGLGSWTENPDKWSARSGSGDNRSSGLRNFSDYVHGLTVRRPDGSSAGKMRFGLWVEPDRFDPGLGHSKRVSSHWALFGTPILDLSRDEVVDGITDRLQHAIDAYRVDYLKVDANLDLAFDAEVGRTGHFWTRWSAGFERLLANLREANKVLYLEHCASGLKRYWIGLPRLAHGTWLDDDVAADNVGHLLDATDALMLPRMKTVLITEELADHPPGEVSDIVRAYWGGDRQNGGALGFSSRVERWSGPVQKAAAVSLEIWKREVRGQEG